MYLLWKMVVFHCYVSLPEGSRLSIEPWLWEKGFFSLKQFFLNPKMDGWKTTNFLLGKPISRGCLFFTCIVWGPESYDDPCCTCWQSTGYHFRTSSHLKIRKDNSQRYPWYTMNYTSFFARIVWIRGLGDPWLGSFFHSWKKSIYTQ